MDEDRKGTDPVSALEVSLNHIFPPVPHSKIEEGTSPNLHQVSGGQERLSYPTETSFRPFLSL